jgi:hypothetical protein
MKRFDILCLILVWIPTILGICLLVSRSYKQLTVLSAWFVVMGFALISIGLTIDTLTHHK